MRLSRLIFATSLLAAALPALAASSAADAPHVHVQLVVPEDQLYPAGNNLIGLYFKLEPGWHVYWKNAGDAGEPPHIQWTLPAGVTAGPMQFPAPQRLPLGPLMDFGYENEVLFPMQARRRADRERRPKPSSAPKSTGWSAAKSACPARQSSRRLCNSSPESRPSSPAPAQMRSSSSGWQARLPTPLPAGVKAVFQPTQRDFASALKLGIANRRLRSFPPTRTSSRIPLRKKSRPRPRASCSISRKTQASPPIPRS